MTGLRETDQLTPWIQQDQDEGKIDNFILRFNQIKQHNINNKTVHRPSFKIKPNTTFGELLSRKKADIISKLSKKDRGDKTAAITTLPTHEDASGDECVLDQMFPSYSLKRMDKNRSFCRPKRYFDSENPQQEMSMMLKKIINKNQILIKTSSKSFTRGGELNETNKKIFLRSQLKHLPVHNIQKQQNIRLNSTQIGSNRYDQLLLSIKQKQKERAKSNKRFKTEYSSTYCPSDCYKSKNYPSITLPKIQIIQLDC